MGVLKHPQWQHLPYPCICALHVMFIDRTFSIVILLLLLKFSVHSCGSMGGGWTLSLMTNCPPKTGACCSSSRLTEMSSGARCWRRPTPSECVYVLMLMKHEMSCVEPASYLGQRFFCAFWGSINTNFFKPNKSTSTCFLVHMNQYNEKTQNRKINV